MSTITPSTSTPLRPQASSPSTEKASVAAGTASEVEKDSPSVTVSFSEYAKKRMASMREASAKLRAMQANRQEERKAAARQRLEDIKKRIEMLKQLVMALGPEGAKGALCQIKQLAQELGQAASVLKEPSSGGSSEVTHADAAQSGDSAQASETPTAVEAPEEVAPQVDAEPETPAVVATDSQAETTGEADADDDEQSPLSMNFFRGDRDDQQRRADGEELKKVARQLKQLLAMVKAQLSAKPDDETRKLLGDIDKQLVDTEKAASEMTGGGFSLSVSIGATLSITV